MVSYDTRERESSERATRVKSSAGFHGQPDHTNGHHQLAGGLRGWRAVSLLRGVCRGWRDAWGKRPARTRALTVHTTVPQLRQSFECSQLLEAKVCRAIAALGRLDLLQCARENGCPWNVDTCSYAAEGGHLEVLRWCRGVEGCPLDANTCSMAARRGFLDVLEWCRGNGCKWNTHTSQLAALGGHLEVVKWLSVEQPHVPRSRSRRSFRCPQMVSEQWL